MDIEGDLIWGDDDESVVFAQAQRQDRSITFMFANKSKYTQSLPNRIVTCFHDLPVEDDHATFPSRATMREELYSSVRQVWDHCIRHPSITAADVIVEIYEDAQRSLQWRICHESLYSQYTASLLPINKLYQCRESKINAYKTVNYSALVPVQHFGGRGRTALVNISGSLYVYKGVDFGTYLESPTDFQHRKEVFYHEIRTISSLPPHPNIVPPCDTFVAVRKIDDDQQELICGALYAFMSHGTLDDHIEKSKIEGTHLPWIRKATWCYQMASAVAHTHYTAHTFHMDIKPANFLLDADQNLILIDWEQSGAAPYTLAPEADGAWDVKDMATGASTEETTISATPRLVYEKYSGPYRENLAWGQPKWNVFPSWKDTCPRALDAAEVFSLGRTMWMLLNGVAQSELEDSDEVVMSWNDAAEEVPNEWKGIVGRCLDPDPNARIGLRQLVDFWKVVTRDDVA
ncbi:MAG: hypothetical protein Q9205_002399 [Flavoplaca limonia]